MQEALLAASKQWPADGRPEQPRSWLIRVASRAMIDLLRSDYSRREREERVAALDEAEEHRVGTGDETSPGEQDDSLILLFMCCDPCLSPGSQIALTLRAVGGLATEEIAAAFLVPDATMGQRISRAKQAVKRSGAPFQLPSAAELPDRLSVVLHVLYLIFNEGYVATSGPELFRSDLSAEAIRLTRMLHRSLPAQGEVTGLLALMLLTDARRPARADSDGSAVPIAEQDRNLWNRQLINEGTALVTGAMSHSLLGPYQVQAAIAALHDETARAEDTDWRQILALYALLQRLDDSPMVTLNKAVAMAMVVGPQAGLDLLARLDDDERVARHHRLAAVRGHLLEMAGRLPEALVAYREAAQRTTSTPERRHLQARAARLLVAVREDVGTKTCERGRRGSGQVPGAYG